ncbi:hypothetical protein L1D04_19070 [Klebsiella pneumoniae]|uniref:Uncharacterized protein n=2 Tax=Klebsiella pneumoniae TaxID=573 RepID=A0A486U2V4_KLEPN|nr:hypothetical protein [Klebsiella pneumoniae]EIW5038744.1 hypothetical protein [Klebsiella pneumoniae]EXF41435.1 hypothetical protein N035_004655 [Klebsiella pneumoniae EGD-HP19-C]KMI58906.1 hypothetical protein SM94_02106 [Klebsiella pneumoniae]MBK2720083.1 hypothetical protein [Klebsiella pneumoniae]MBQ5050457.1 hypothetical protein [Klebsiella pneumoniae]
MISVIKDLFSNQVVSAVILTIIGAITKKYIQFHRRDFFSRSSSEQIKAVEWLRTSSVPISDPLAKAEQQFRLQSFGLHRDWHLSYKIICLSSDYAQSLIPSLKAVLRYQGMYTITNGNIYPHKFHKWIIPFVLISLLLYIGAEIYRGSSQSDGIEILKSLYVVIVAFIVWCWVAACALRVSSISKKLNVYIPPANDFKSKTYDFSSILNNRYP